MDIISWLLAICHEMCYSFMLLCFTPFNISAISLSVLVSYIRLLTSPVRVCARLCVCELRNCHGTGSVIYIKWGSVCAAVLCTVCIRSRIRRCKCQCRFRSCANYLSYLNECSISRKCFNVSLSFLKKEKQSLCTKNAIIFLCQ